MGGVDRVGERRWRLVAKLIGCLPLLLLFTGSPTTAAAQLPEFLWQSPEDGKKGAGTGRLSSPPGLAADPISGHVFVTDFGNSRVNEFDAWGQFVQAWGWDVAPEGAPGDTPANQFETCGPSEPEAAPPSGLCQKGVSGSGPGQFNVELKGGISVDPNNGDVYVGDTGNQRVQKFDPDGGSGGKASFLLAFGTPGSGDGQFEGPIHGNRTAVNSASTVFVGDSAGRIKVFESNGTPQPQITLAGFSEAIRSLAMDASGNFYVIGSGDTDNIHKFSSTGGALTSIPANLTVESPLALDADGNIYTTVEAAGGAGEVVEFAPDGTAVIAPGSGFALQGSGFFLKGLATNTVTAAGATDIYFSTGSGTDSFVAAYGPPPDKWPPPVKPPEIVSQFTASADTDSAVLKAQINPRYWADTAYYVEYGTGKCSEEGCTSQQPVPPGDLLGAGVVSKPVTSNPIELLGLEQGTTYHYRFVAESSGGGPVRGAGGKVGIDGAEGTFKTRLPLGELTCPNAAFRSGVGGRLPDCRAYEMTSPVDKNNTDILALININSNPSALNQAALAGDGLTYSTSQGFGDSKGTPYTSQYLARRDPDKGWLSHGISPPQGLNVIGVGVAAEVQYRYFSPDLCHSVLADTTDAVLDPAAPEGFANFYKSPLCAGEPEPYEALNFEEPNLPVAQFLPDLQAATADGSCGAFKVNDSLTPDADPGTNTQVYKSCDGVMSLISMLPGEVPSAVNSSLGTGKGTIRSASVTNALSEDGSRAYWTAASEGPGDLYLRAELPSGEEGTLAVSGSVLPGANGRFWAASEDGARALFTVEDEAFSGINHNLYEFSLQEEGGELNSTVSLLGKKVTGVMGASEDAKRAYFVSTEAIAGAGENPQGASPAAGQSNLYLHEALEGGGQRVAFVGVLTSDDARIGTVELPTPLEFEPHKHTARVSPDGLHAVFLSRAILTGYDNLDANNGKVSAEVFRYSGEEGAEELTCVSCNPTGVRPSGRELVLEEKPTNIWAAASIPGYASQLYGSRVISDDGSRVFFTSYEALSLADINGKADVYQWQKLGAGGEFGCVEEDPTFDSTSGGCVDLISSGQGEGDAEFLDASADGADVFFATAESLVPQDPGLIDIYDARVGGGFPPPSVPGPECATSDNCRNPIATPEAAPPPPASTAPAPPNPPVKKAKKPKKKHKGKKHHQGKKGKGKAKRAHKERRGGR